MHVCICDLDIHVTLQYAFLLTYFIDMYVHGIHVHSVRIYNYYSFYIAILGNMSSNPLKSTHDTINNKLYKDCVLLSSSNSNII